MGYLVACFLGHRKINITDKFVKSLYDIIENLITEKQVDTFLFGSNSEFDKMCLEIVTKIKMKYIHIKRVYVRAEYPYIDQNYKKFLLNSYEETYYPKTIENSGKATYIKRNKEMIDKSDFCVFYYDKEYLPARRKKSKRDLIDYQPKSGTAIAYNYAVQKKKEIINIVDVLS